MIKKIVPGARCGCVRAPSSKSIAHRKLAIAALADYPSDIVIDGVSDDIRRTIDCLNALGAHITENGSTLKVLPIGSCVKMRYAELFPGESGTTLRFMLPLAGALGVEAVIRPEGRLKYRPVKELTDELCRHGMSFSFDEYSIRASGTLIPGEYALPGNVSSQYISALLLTLPRLDGDSSVNVTGSLESKGYIGLTLRELGNASVHITERGSVYEIKGPQAYAPATASVIEGDWSNAAFFLCMGALSESGVCVRGLDTSSAQGDRQILDILSHMGAKIDVTANEIYGRKGDLKSLTLDVAQIPDLVPAVSALMALADGESRIANARRLRLKESDRLMSTFSFLNAVGADVALDKDDIIIKGRRALPGGEADACGDHRIAMALTLAACGCENAVTIKGAEAVNKSFPDFFDRFDCLEAEK